MNQRKLNYIHYYFLSIVASILVWGGFEYVSICNGQNCMIDTARLWKGLVLITLIFIPITLCIWSEFFNGQIKILGRFLKRTYEEQILIFGVLIFAILFLTSYKIFNIYWSDFVGDRASKEYVAALVNVAIFVATLFAPIAALLLFNNWKVQHNKTLFANEAKVLWNEVNQAKHDFISNKGIYTVGAIKEKYVKDSAHIKTHFKKSALSMIDSLNKTIYFGKLTNNPRFNDLLHKINKPHTRYGNRFNFSTTDYSDKDYLITVHEYYEKQEKDYQDILKVFDEILDELHNYILIK